MKLFQEARKNFETLGISSIQESQINRNLLKTYILYILSVHAFVIFFFHEAKTLQEYINNVCVTIEMVTGIIILTTTALKSKELFGFIDDVNDYLEKSKYLLSKNANKLKNRMMWTIDIST